MPASLLEILKRSFAPANPPVHPPPVSERAPAPERDGQWRSGLCGSAVGRNVRGSAEWGEEGERVIEAYLGLGSNVGSREAHLGHALARLEAESRLTGVSSVYETDPVGFTGQRAFLNAVARIETEQAPLELLQWMRSIEADRGRVRTFPGAPRTLDIDVLLYGDLELSLGRLTVPHPRMHARAFVLIPLLELAPATVDPRTGRPYAEWLAALQRGPGDGDPGDPGDLGIRRVMNGKELLDGHSG